MTWLDGYGGDTALGGSTAGYIDAPFVETSVVNGGRQSLPLIFDNDGGFVDIDGNAGSPRFSEVRREFDANVDLTEGGAQVLAVSFRGTPAAEDVAIAQDPVYIVLEDRAGKSSTVVHSDAQAVQSGAWQT